MHRPINIHFSDRICCAEGSYVEIGNMTRLKVLIPSDNMAMRDGYTFGSL